VTPATYTAKERDDSIRAAYRDQVLAWLEREDRALLDVRSPPTSPVTSSLREQARTGPRPAQRPDQPLHRQGGRGSTDLER